MRVVEKKGDDKAERVKTTGRGMGEKAKLSTTPQAQFPGHGWCGVMTCDRQNNEKNWLFLPFEQKDSSKIEAFGTKIK